MASKILVVDDEPEFIDMLSLRLEANGYNVVTAFSGDECLEKIAADKPDAVLLDVQMPGIDGIETLKRIRKRHRGLPVFIVTAHADEEIFRRARRFEVSGFVVKTSDLSKEIANITNALRISPMYKARTSVSIRRKKK